MWKKKTEESESKCTLEKDSYQPLLALKMEGNQTARITGSLEKLGKLRKQLLPYRLPKGI